MANHVKAVHNDLVYGFFSNWRKKLLFIATRILPSKSKIQWHQAKKQVV